MYRVVMRCKRCLLWNYNSPLSRNSTRTFFFLPNSSLASIKYNDSAIVNYPRETLFNVVADVDNYYKFVPNCFESSVLERPSPNLIRAKLSVGIPRVIKAEYISTVRLTKPEHILARSEENKFMRFLESEWHFIPMINSKGSKVERTLVKFRVEFQMRSQLTANLIGLVFDDFTHKTMEAFLTRAELFSRQSSSKGNKPLMPYK